MEKEILTVADAAQLLSLSETEVEKLLCEGEIPGRRIGAHWFLSRQRLLEFIAAGESSAPKSEEVVTAPPQTVPAKVLSPNWRCDSCQRIHPPDVVECTHCGAVRNTPLMGFCLPSDIASLRAGFFPKVN